MSGKVPENRVFVGGLSWDVGEHELEDAFRRYGKITDVQMPLHGMAGCVWIVLDRDTGRPRGFGFLTFEDRRDMEIAIREMDGRELGDHAISVNKAQPRGGGEDPIYGYPSGGGRVSYGGGGDRFSGEDCYKCGRSGHWARDCSLSGGDGQGRGGFSSLSGFGGGRGRGDRFGGDRDRYIDDRYDGGHYGRRDRYESREKFAPRERFVPDRYPPSGDRFDGGDRYGEPDSYPENGFGKAKGYERDIVAPRGGGGDRYRGGSGPTRYEGKSYKDRPAPYDRPKREGGGPSSYDNRY